MIKRSPSGNVNFIQEIVNTTKFFNQPTVTTFYSVLAN